MSSLLIERTLSYHNEHQGLCCTECVHQLIPESVEGLVTAVTDERRLPQVDCFAVAVDGKLTVHLAWETDTEVLDQSFVVERNTS